MKRLALVFIASIGPLVLGSCQEKLEWEEVKFDVVAGNTEPTKYDDSFEYEEIINFGETRTSQGGDSWGDFFFQFNAKNTSVRVYNLSTKSLVQTIEITSSLKGFVPNCHCNSVNFGNEYFDEEDIFPLIYVSTNYAAGGYSGALVYRITQHNGTFFINLVQTIYFPVDGSTWTEFIPSNDYAYLCYTYERVIFKVPMPKLKDGNIIISRDNAIEKYQFSPQPEWMFSSRNQDRIFYQGKIYVISGVPQSGEASVIFALNLETLERESIIDFKKNGLTKEPESIFIWQGNICVAFIDKIVKIFL